MPPFAALYWFSGFLQPRCGNPSELSVLCSKLSLHLDVMGKAKGWRIYFSFICIICSETLWFVTAIFRPELEDAELGIYCFCVKRISSSTQFLQVLHPLAVEAGWVQG